MESVSYKVANFLGQSHSLFSSQLEPWMGREETQNQSFIVFVFCCCGIPWTNLPLSLTIRGLKITKLGTYPTGRPLLQLRHDLPFFSLVQKSTFCSSMGMRPFLFV